MSDQPWVEAEMDLGGGRRLTVAEDALAMEVRGAGQTWARVRVIPYEDIRALYRYQVTDWSALGLLVTIWLVLLVVLFVAAGLSGWSPTVTLATTGLSTLLILGIAAFRLTRAPSRKLKIEAYSGMLLVADSSPVFFDRLATRVGHQAVQAAASINHELDQSNASPSNSEPVTDWSMPGSP